MQITLFSSNSIRHIVAAGLLFAAAATTVAMPPLRGKIHYAQPSGGSVTIELQGNASNCTYLSADGYILQPDELGNLCYVVKEPFTDNLRRTQTIALDNPALQFTAKENFVKSQARLLKSPEATTHKIGGFPTKGKPKVLVVLARFSDLDFTTPNVETKLRRMLSERGYSDNGASGSALDYFSSNSDGAFEPEIVIAGPVTLPQTMRYYGEPSSSGAADSHPAEMIRDACTLIDEAIDFADFDNDSDGRIDNVYVIYPGYSQADGANPNTIWPHSAFAWSSLSAVFDNVCLDRYACSNELDIDTGAIVEIGTFCHEFSHVLGLPDLYPTLGSHNNHPSTWDIMADGGRNNQGKTPPMLSAYERMVLGWLNPETITPSDVHLSIEPLSANKAFIIPNKSNDSEFFVVENRVKDGWDAHLPGQGMLVWRISHDSALWNANQVNNDPNFQNIDLIEADGNPSVDRSGDSYPGTNDVRELESTRFATTNGQNLTTAICNIREADNNNLMFNLVDTSRQLSAIETQNASDITPVSFRAVWKTLPEARYYAIEVYSKSHDGSSSTKHHASGYRMKIVPADSCSIFINNLEPETDYYYTVRGFGNSFAGIESKEVCVRTLDKDFRFEQPTGLNALDITDNSFTASWGVVEGNSHYLLTVAETELSDFETIQNDFSQGDIDGWKRSSGCSLSEWYYGTSAPGLSMNGDYFIESPQIDGKVVSSLKMWYRALKTGHDDVNAIIVEGLCDNGWETIASLTSLTLDAEGETLEFKRLPLMCRAIRISFVRPYGSGTAIIDDIELSYASSVEKIVEGYSNRNVGNETKCSVSGLKPETDYQFSVTAHNGQMESRKSIWRNFTTKSSESSTETIVADSPILIWEDAGAIHIQSSNSKDVEQIRIATTRGELIATFQLKNNDHVVYKPNSPGLYIVASDRFAKKIAVRK